jgi:hypothetical protein
VHAEDAAVALYFPATQAATLVPSPVKPAPATQSEDLLDPVVVTPVFNGQFVQAAEDSDTVLNVPAAQAATLVPSPV